MMSKDLIESAAHLNATFRLYCRALLKKDTTRERAILDSLLMIMSPMTCTA